MERSSVKRVLISVDWSRSLTFEERGILLAQYYLLHMVLFRLFWLYILHELNITQALLTLLDLHPVTLRCRLLDAARLFSWLFSGLEHDKHQKQEWSGVLSEVLVYS